MLTTFAHDRWIWHVRCSRFRFSFLFLFCLAVCCAFRFPLVPIAVCCWQSLYSKNKTEKKHTENTVQNKIWMNWLPCLYHVRLWRTHKQERSKKEKKNIRKKNAENQLWMGVKTVEIPFGTFLSFWQSKRARLLYADRERTVNGRKAYFFYSVPLSSCLA